MLNWFLQTLLSVSVLRAAELYLVSDHCCPISRRPCIRSTYCFSSRFFSLIVFRSPSLHVVLNLPLFYLKFEIHLVRRIWVLYCFHNRIKKQLTFFSMSATIEHSSAVEFLHFLLCWFVTIWVASTILFVVLLSIRPIHCYILLFMKVLFILYFRRLLRKIPFWQLIAFLACIIQDLISFSFSLLLPNIDRSIVGKFRCTSVHIVCLRILWDSLFAILFLLLIPTFRFIS